MKNKPRESLRMIVLGDSEHGKSHWVKSLVDSMPSSPPVLVWDPTHEWAGRSADRPIRAANCFSSVAAACRAVAEGRSLARIVFQCGHDNEADFERVCKLAHDAGDVTLVVDEAHIYCQQGRCPRYLLTLMRISRHRRVNLILVAQRPHGLAVDLRTQCSDTVLFHMSSESSIDWVRSERSPELAERVARLKPREWIHWRARGIVAVSSSGSTCGKSRKKSRAAS